MESKIKLEYSKSEKGEKKRNVKCEAHDLKF
jgi:hypothetical protein